MKRILNILCVSLLCLGYWGCSADESTENPRSVTTLETAEQAVIATREGLTTYFTVTSNSGWTAKPQGSWVHITPSSGNNGTTTVALTVDPASDDRPRGAGVFFTSENSVVQFTVPVFQMKQTDLVVSPDVVPTIGKEGTTLTFTVASHNEYDVDTNCDWITAEPVKTVSPQIAVHTFTVPANEGRGRSTRITFTGKTADVSAEVTVTQEGVKLIPDKEGATIKGEVTCESMPVEGVVVSDGFEVTTTDKDGCYWLASKKKNGSVFISIPGGYMVDTDGSIPAFWRATTAAADVVEEHSFSLRREPNTNHILLATTDPHMANRYNYNKTYTDTPQYRNDFRGDIDAFVKEYGTKNVYAICLGDLTWDIYWYDVGTLYTLEDYRKEIENFPVPYFQVMGNHDYDMKFTDDFKAAEAFRRIIGPTYYSFNLGDVHYVVLDNMYYLNKDGDRSHDTYVDDEQLAWLKKDLEHADKSKPVFVCMHCSAYAITSVSDNKVNVNPNFKNAKTAELGDCFKGFASVHYLTGDTHINRAVANEDMPAGYGNIFEHNMAAICASWWWTGYISKNSICKDGSEGGYMIFTNNGGDVKWRWKGMKVAADKQFRTYDMNVVKNHYATDASVKAFLQKYITRSRYTACKENTVYINVWNWDSGWKISVKENGQPLTVTQVRAEDPLHNLSYDIPRTASNGSLTSSFATYNTTHIFSAEAASATSTLEIVVTDRFGVTYTESMTRPKAYTTYME